ncbi:MAG: hypothetical protein M1296_01020 [Chloroflexi bacterium]|nr:hypothetical protein [Chloroflexota bacterium]
MTGQLCLTLVDTSSIQHYIFGSNRLKENAGGSEVVRWVTDDALRQACEYVCGQAVAWRTVMDAPQAPALLQDGPEQATLLFAAAGNAALLFRSREVARQVITVWSRQLLVQAPGLRVAVVHELFSPGELGKQWRRARQRLTKAKEAPPPAGPLQGISLTRSCPNTGMAAAGTDHRLVSSDITDGRPIPVQRASRALSPVAACRLDCARAATRRLKEEFRDILGDHFAFPDRAEDLGQREEENYLAVVHADGNGLGKRFASLLAEDAGDDGLLVERIQQFVRDVQGASAKALRAVISALVHDYDSLVEKKRLRKCEKSGEWLPIRPLVFGGDDVTFVCHGCLGLSLAARYLQAFASEKDSNGTPFSACAGVTIAHAKAPFARAYGLAEELCRSAKARNAAVDGPPASWLDAHLAIDGLELPLHEIRAARVMPRDVGECALDGRPWQVVPDEGESPSWSAVQRAMRCFSEEKWPRSVIRGLVHAFTVSESAVAMMLAQQRLRNRPLDGAYVDGTSPRLQVDSSGRTFVPLFDALELYEYCWEVS